MNKIICPVPQDQRPLNEFYSITKSWIISWPLQDNNTFYSKLVISWLIFLPLNLLISYGSDYLRNNIFDFIFISLTFSLISPLFLLLRQLLSWSYIYSRLNSEKIEYEESGWYDGQVWEKPIDWRAKDLLIAQYQVKPILDHLKKVLSSIFLFMFFLLSFNLLNINL